MHEFKAEFAKGEETFEVVVSGESAETVTEYLDNCGEYDDCVLLSIEQVPGQ